jgi:hypothetical protein
MGKSLVAALLCAPLAAGAQTLFVEYEGTVSSIDRGPLAEVPSYSVGDAIRGTLTIDAARAPSDEVDNRQIGRYYGGSPGIDFILGPRDPAEIGSADLVVVYDDWDPSSDGSPREDGFLINDTSIGQDGASSLVLGLRRPNLLGQLFSNDGLLQSFEAKPEAGANLWGYVERGFGEFWRIVNFTLDRFSVRPGVCRA